MVHYTDPFDDEVRPDDFDGHVTMHQLQIRARLAAHPDPRDPEYPLVDMDDEDDYIETEDFNDEPVPYDSNKEA